MMPLIFDNVDVVKNGKNFRIPSETKLKHSIFDRKRQNISSLRPESVYISSFDFRGHQKTCKPESG